MFIFLSFIILLLILSPFAHAQYWTALPPYNTLWPLWSLPLSPPDPFTGAPTPIINQLTSDTILPVEPGLTWNPALADPWLLYNTPFGLVYFDPIFGLNLWPPTGFLDAFGLPIQLPLSPDFALLPPTPFSWIDKTVPLANSALELKESLRLKPDDQSAQKYFIVL